MPRWLVYVLLVLLGIVVVKDPTFLGHVGNSIEQAINGG